MTFSNVSRAIGLVAVAVFGCQTETDSARDTGVDVADSQPSVRDEGPVGDCGEYQRPVLRLERDGEALERLVVAPDTPTVVDVVTLGGTGSEQTGCALSVDDVSLRVVREQQFLRIVAMEERCLGRICRGGLADQLSSLRLPPLAPGEYWLALEAPDADGTYPAAVEDLPRIPLVVQ